MILDTELIRRRRRELGWSQREVGRRIGVSPATVARLEDGVNHDDLPLRQLVRLADALAVDTADLFPRATLAAPTDSDLVQRVGALLAAANDPVATATLAAATGASTDDVDTALSQLDVALQHLGSRVHHGSRGVDIVPSARAADPNEVRTLLRGQHAAHGLTRLDAQLLSRAATGTIDRARAGNADQVALARLENAGLIDADLELTDDVRYSLGS